MTIGVDEKEWYEAATTLRNAWRAICNLGFKTISAHKNHSEQHHATTLSRVTPARGPSAEKETRRGTNASKRG